MKNVKVSYVAADFRPAFVFDDVKGIAMTTVTIPAAIEMPIILFNNTTGIDTKNLVLPVAETKAILNTNYK